MTTGVVTVNAAELTRIFHAFPRGSHLRVKGSWCKGINLVRLITVSSNFPPAAVCLGCDSALASVRVPAARVFKDPNPDPRKPPRMAAISIHFSAKNVKNFGVGAHQRFSCGADYRWRFASPAVPLELTGHFPSKTRWPRASMAAGLVSSSFLNCKWPSLRFLILVSPEEGVGGCCCCSTGSTGRDSASPVLDSADW